MEEWQASGGRGTHTGMGGRLGLSLETTATRGRVPGLPHPCDRARKVLGRAGWLSIESHSQRLAVRASPSTEMGWTEVVSQDLHGGRLARTDRGQEKSLSQ